MPPNMNQIQQLQNYVAASWALWSENFNNPGCLEANRQNILPFMQQNLQQLKTDTILLGLNRAPGVLGAAFQPFHNFHGVPHRGDRTLKHYIQDNNLANLVGAYMTDLNSVVVNANGNQVNADLNDLQIIMQQLAILRGDFFTVICFGTKSFQLLLGLLNLNQADANQLQHNILHIETVRDAMHLNIFRVWHYTDRGYNHLNVLQLAAQLAHLN